MEPEQARAALAADYPDWCVFRRDAVVCAWLPHVRTAAGDLVNLRDATVAGLRLRLATYTRVAETGSPGKALDAAEALET